MSTSVLTNALNALVRTSANAPTAAIASANGARSLATALSGSSYSLPDLKYDYAALEPHLSAEIMELHHSKHHKTYVTNLNAAMEKYLKAEAAGNVAEMISLQGAIRFNGGGHVNHSIFWNNLAPPSAGGGGEPTGDLADLIRAKWGSFDKFKVAMNAAGASVQGSGWAWLVYNKASKGLDIISLANQDPVNVLEYVPLLGIDVWEHAYYLQVRIRIVSIFTSCHVLFNVDSSITTCLFLQYKNVRANYLEAIWNVVNFNDVANRLAQAKLV